MMPFQPVLLWSDLLLWLLVALTVAGGLWASGQPHLVAAWRQIGQSRVGMGSGALLAVFLLIALLDSLHYRPQLPDVPLDSQPARHAAKPAVQYGVEVHSLLDTLLAPLRERQEKTYSAPLATHLFAKEATADGLGRDFPRLKYGGAHLGENLSAHGRDLAIATVRGLAGGFIVWVLISVLLRPAMRTWPLAWDGALIVLLGVCLLAGLAMALTQNYHPLGTDKVGQDVLYQALKSIRTGMVIGLLATLIMLPAAIVLGLMAGYFGGWVDDVIQYLYTTLNSIPGVLLIAAAVLMMQVIIETHPQWFATAAERADARLLALCAILGITSWTSLCRLLRGEVLKLRELEYVQAARAFGVSHATILVRHILPNVMHLIIIALVMDFSGLVLAEAVLSYVGVGVDPTTLSFGTMINAARLELAREPMVWWSLAAAFSFMFALVLAANLFADVVRDAFDPRVGR